jgi:predicted RecA/RadA family phage recombinase
MPAEATYLRDSNDMRISSLVAACASGEVYQLGDGRAAVKQGLNAAAAADAAAFSTTGIHTVAKTTGIVLLDGGRAYWDHSANSVTYKKVNDRDFYVGRVVGDATSASTTCNVNFNIDPSYDIDIHHDGILAVPVGTAAAGGFGFPVTLGGSTQLELSATSEAQKIDALTVDRFAVAAKGIAEFIIRPAGAGSTSAVDINIGLANGTHATDFESVTEACVFHIDGGSLAINAQSRDGTTTVAVVDTTKVIVEGSAVAQRTEFWIDFRDSSDIQLYVDGVNVLPSSVFKLNAATGPLGLIAHLEKTTGTATAKYVLDAMRARLMQQAAAS